MLKEPTESAEGRNGIREISCNSSWCRQIFIYVKLSLQEAVASSHSGCCGPLAEFVCTISYSAGRQAKEGDHRQRREEGAAAHCPLREGLAGGQAGAQEEDRGGAGVTCILNPSVQVCCAILVLLGGCVKR